MDLEAEFEMVDFEIGAMNALRFHFPNIVISWLFISPDEVDSRSSSNCKTSPI